MLFSFSPGMKFGPVGWYSRTVLYRVYPVRVLKRVYENLRSQKKPILYQRQIILALRRLALITLKIPLICRRTTMKDFCLFFSKVLKIYVVKNNER